MNKIETIVYGLVKSHPGIKKVVKSIYQGAFDMLPRKAEFFMNEFDYQEGAFFGFHDVSPISQDETRCLANKTPFDGRMPMKGEAMEIGYFDFRDGKFGSFHSVSKTFAWNFHKGCRLQWVDNTTIIYNTADGDKLISAIRNLQTGEERIIPYPIDAIYSGGNTKLATSFSYQRLNRCMPGYGYAVGDDDNDEDAPDNTGLFLVNLTSGERRLLVTLKDLATKIGNRYTNGYTHFVTHTEFSCDGKYIAFLYRAAPKGQEGKDMHKTWILVYDLENKALIELPTQESGSHFVWNHKNEMIASCIIDGKNCHVLFDISNPRSAKIIAGNILNSDGHQSFLTDNIFITDTYPDRRRMSKLYKVNTVSSSTVLIAEVFSPKQFQTKDVYCHIACDLHPRVSPSGKYVCFDSPRTGKRALYVMSLN